MGYEAHGHDLEDALECEEVAEHHTHLLKDLVVLGFILKVRLIVRNQDTGVENDQKDDKVLKEWRVGTLYQPLSKLGRVMEEEE